MTELRGKTYIHTHIHRINIIWMDIPEYMLRIGETVPHILTRHTLHS